MANGVRFLIMSENKKKILWRCSSMATKKIKCPARITMLKENPPKFIINKAQHVHAELKRNKYGSTKQQQSQNVEIDTSVSFDILDVDSPSGGGGAGEQHPQQQQHHQQLPQELRQQQQQFQNAIQQQQPHLQAAPGEDDVGQL